MKVLASLVVAFAIMFSAPASNAVDLPKLDGLTSLVDTVKTKKRSSRARREQCVSDCVSDCWWFNCQATCRCHCYGPRPPQKSCPPLM